MNRKISIEEAIEQAGLKKKYVAEKLGVNAGYINTYLKNAKNISLENAFIICSLTKKNIWDVDFGIEINEFFLPKDFINNEGN